MALEFFKRVGAMRKFKIGSRSTDWHVTVKGENLDVAKHKAYQAFDIRCQKTQRAMPKSFELYLIEEIEYHGRR